MVTVRRLQKWHGAGNDFLVDVCDPGEGEWWTRSRARAVCHRTTGGGADGLLVATLTSPVTMVLFNSDGSTAEMTGNGIRCLAAAVRRSTNATFSSLDVATFAGLVVTEDATPVDEYRHCVTDTEEQHVATTVVDMQDACEISDLSASMRVDRGG